jgi:hypothetical protein
LRSIVLAAGLCLAIAAHAQTTTDAPTTPAPEKSGRTMSSLFWPPVSEASRAEPLTVGQKLQLSVYNTVNPYPIAAAAVNAGISQAADTNSGYGQGAEGYGKRFGAAYASNASTQFFGTFVYPSLLRQDPRYFRKETGTNGSRFGYALSRVFVTRNDSGSSGPNVSLWAGAATSAAISNLYYPPGDRSAGDAVKRAGISLATQAGFNVMKEFWPDIKRKFRGGSKP